MTVLVAYGEAASSLEVDGVDPFEDYDYGGVHLGCQCFRAAHPDWDLCELDFWIVGGDLGSEFDASGSRAWADIGWDAFDDEPCHAGVSLNLGDIEKDFSQSIAHFRIEAEAGG